MSRNRNRILLCGLLVSATILGACTDRESHGRHADGWPFATNTGVDGGSFREDSTSAEVGRDPGRDSGSGCPPPQAGSLSLRPEITDCEMLPDLNELEGYGHVSHGFLSDVAGRTFPAGRGSTQTILDVSAQHAVVRFPGPGVDLNFDWYGPDLTRWLRPGQEVKAFYPTGSAAVYLHRGTSIIRTEKVEIIAEAFAGNLRLGGKDATFSPPLFFQWQAVCGSLDSKALLAPRIRSRTEVVEIPYGGNGNIGPWNVTVRRAWAWKFSEQSAAGADGLTRIDMSWIRKRAHSECPRADRN